MYTQLATINKDRHAATKVKPTNGFQYAARFHVASVLAHEFPRAASIYPVVFLKDQASGRYQPVALLGLEEGQNLFVDDAGRWKASYVPAVIRRYPFALAAAGDDATFAVCIDEGSSLVNQEEGLPLFDEQGQPAQALQNVVKYLSELQQMDAQTQAFCQFLAEQDLLVPLNMQLQLGQEIKNVQGAFAINEAKLAALTDEQFIQMRQRGYLPAVYAHLVSLTQVERLLMLQGDARNNQVEAQDAQAASAEPEAPSQPVQPVTTTVTKPSKKAGRRR